MPKRRKESEVAATSPIAADDDDDSYDAADNVYRDRDAADGAFSKRNVYSSSSSNNSNTINYNDQKINKYSEGDGGGVGGEDSTAVDGKSSNAIPIFLKKTYRMIDTCDPEICSWSPDGDMFVVKNPVRTRRILFYYYRNCFGGPASAHLIVVYVACILHLLFNIYIICMNIQDLFASDIIPQYFDHNKFSSFARQLNFYGFRKIQTKPIRNNDYDQSTAKHVTFYNDKFKRGRYDLLKEITRSTRGGGGGVGGLAGNAAAAHAASFVDQVRELENLHSTVLLLEQTVRDMDVRMQTLAMKMEQDIQAKVEYAVMNLFSNSSAMAAAAASSSSRNNPAHHPYRQSSTQSVHQLHAAASHHPSQYMGGGGGGVNMPSLPTFGETTSTGSYQNPNPSFGDASIVQSFGNLVRGWENPAVLGAHVARALSTGAAAAAAQAHAAASAVAESAGGAEQGGGGGSSGANGAPTLPPHPKQKSLPPPPPSMGGSTSLGGGGMSAATANAVSANILRNAWEDKFFSTLMMSDGTNPTVAASRAASLAGLVRQASGGGGMGGLVQQASGGGGVGDISGLVALAAAQQQMQQHHAAMGQAQAQQQQLAHAQAAVAAALMQQRASSFGITIGNAAAAADPRLMRQSTAEILLEAAGELGNSSRSKSGAGGGGGSGGNKEDKGRQTQAEV